MIWLETSPEATRLQVVFRSNQKKKTNKQTNKKTTDAKVSTICYLFASLLFYNAWVQYKTKSQCEFHYIYMRNIHEEDIIHLKRMERKNDFNLLKGLEEVFYRQKVLELSLR